MASSFIVSFNEARKLKLKSDIPLWFFGIFVGWNGIQFLLFGNVNIDFLLLFSVEDLIISIIVDHNQYLPFFIYTILSLLIVYTFFNVLLEIKLNHKFISKSNNHIEILNFFVSYLAVLLVPTIIFIIVMISLFQFSHATFNVTISVIKMYVITLFYIRFFILDFILSEFFRSKSLFKSIIKVGSSLSKNITGFIKFYLFKFLLIMITLLLYNLILETLVSLFRFVPNHIFDYLNFFTPLDSFPNVTKNLFLIVSFVLFSMTIIAPLIQRFFVVLYLYKKKLFPTLNF